jgi:hypothetical protein
MDNIKMILAEDHGLMHEGTHLSEDAGEISYIRGLQRRG